MASTSTRSSTRTGKFIGAVESMGARARLAGPAPAKAARAGWDLPLREVVRRAGLALASDAFLEIISVATRADPRDAMLIIMARAEFDELVANASLRNPSPVPSDNSVPSAPAAHLVASED